MPVISIIKDKVTIIRIRIGHIMQLTNFFLITKKLPQRVTSGDNIMSPL